jgi:hypothetical protein
MINNTRTQKLLCAAFSAALLMIAVPAALAAPLSNTQGTETAACAHSSLGHACAEDWDEENIAAR